MPTSTIISGSKVFDGLYRAIVIEAVDTPTDSKNSNVAQKSCRLYIPALHREQMPFKLSDSGEIQGCIFDLTPEENKQNDSLTMQKENYPIAQVCSWGVCPQFTMGEQVWIMFENGDSEFPVVIGNLAATLPLSSELTLIPNSEYSAINPLEILETTITFVNGQKFYNNLMRPISGVDRGYAADEGLDIVAPIGTPIYSPCDGTFVYSEFGHTPWGRTKFGTKKDDTAYSIGININTPFNYAGKTISYIFLTHLSKLVYNIPSGKGGQQVKAGELIAYSGTANDSPHLHIGLSPANWNPLRNDEVRAVFGSTYGQTWEVGK